MNRNGLPKKEAYSGREGRGGLGKEYKGGRKVVSDGIGSRWEIRNARTRRHY